MKSISDICPKWSKYLDLLNKGLEGKAQAFKARNGIVYMDVSRCMVGEAHGFDGKYNELKYNNDSMLSERICNECHEFSCGDKALSVVVTAASKGKEWKRLKRIRDFVRHWNEDHENTK